jgi:hypothetical protein
MGIVEKRQQRNVSPMRTAHVVALSLLACNRDHEKLGDPAASTPSSAPTIQVRIGAPTAVENELPFTITTVYPGEKPAATAPWHVPGGDWVFFDATTGDGASFVFGIHTGKSADMGGATMKFGEALLGAKDRDAGSRFVASFASGFHVPLPAPPATQNAPTALKPSVVVLAESAVRGQRGGFGGAGGGWTATKLTVESRNGEEEVFFNFDLGARRGELTEKDQEYDTALATDLAGALRDGTFLPP